MAASVCSLIPVVIIVLLAQCYFVEVRQAIDGDAQAIAEVHVASWQGAYRGLLPDALLDGQSVERRAQWWTQAIANPR